MMELDIITRGGGGDFPVSGTDMLRDPLSVGRKKGEAQWALL